ncbi:2-C-methyl-D-erythritol 4-phosphate cytidylyltransferase [Natranaerovirga pectinivora]|uniref:2-C-methyl-D-erythritol 4-phosphate cytidylyltransferase n=1 Tax=Natranaerovirga pectinivora TaxID=682400 RepID=A0A4R3MNT0_9FIRM|nr:2-C-methyl-D-erythritol 4-phosphate cytidylyltransferase [Natranaerovirga pectinivora]TCT13769.1 2-C-methyl-D-erythritol 4-phosphate cytidylyltransferase [Natranaerovirga pectinivora]
MREKVTAIILAAGQGKRMKSNIQKQYISLGNKPIIVYALSTFSKCKEIDEIVVVVSPGDINYFKKEIIDKYNIEKVVTIVEGGKERYHSVYNALKYIDGNNNGYVLIHDGARPFVRKEEIKKCITSVKEYKACVLGVPSKDTIKKVEKEGFIEGTVDRKNLWLIQTPQGFSFELIKEAYVKFFEDSNTNITDDAMIVENYSDKKVKIVEGSYNNIKITTPEDLIFGEAILKHYI